MTRATDIRATSRAAFASILASGLIEGRRLEALRGVCLEGPGTAHEIFTRPEQQGLWKRLSELRVRGVIWEQGTRKCRVTGQRAIVWAATGRTIPSDIPEPDPRAPECSHCGGTGKEPDTDGVLNALANEQGSLF